MGTKATRKLTQHDCLPKGNLMHRREVLTRLAAGAAITGLLALAGCQSDASPPTPVATSTPSPWATPSPEASPSAGG
jgi:hypothetical protein